jgi:hypothetical protein
MHASRRNSCNPHALRWFLIVIVELVPEVVPGTYSKLLRRVSAIVGAHKRRCAGAMLD